MFEKSSLSSYCTIYAISQLLPSAYSAKVYALHVQDCKLLSKNRTPPPFEILSFEKSNTHYAYKKLKAHFFIIYNSVNSQTAYLMVVFFRYFLFYKKCDIQTQSVGLKGCIFYQRYPPFFAIKTTLFMNIKGYSLSMNIFVLKCISRTETFSF